MKEIPYRKFSLNTHNKNFSVNKLSVCQFELTFGCGLRCKHCYSDCYNKPTLLKKELKTGEVKLIIDKVYDAGIIWLCLTGGDPLSRPDFLEIYSYAKNKGFIISIFTNAYSMSEEISKELSKMPPFVIEITINAVTENLYESISQIKGSFSKTMNGIELMLKEKLPLKIKTMVTKDNFEELSQVKNYVESLGLKFDFDFKLNACLDGNLKPVNLRISPNEAINLSETNSIKCEKRNSDESNDFVFPCAIDTGDGIHIDPYGNLFLCDLIREPSVNLLKADIHDAVQRLKPNFSQKKFASDSKCKSCEMKVFCTSCPGMAYLENGNMESPVDFHCEIAKLMFDTNNE